MIPAIAIFVAIAGVPSIELIIQWCRVWRMERRLLKFIADAESKSREEVVDG